MKRITEKQKNNVVMLYQETKLKNYQIAELCNLSTISCRFFFIDSELYP